MKNQNEKLLKGLVAEITGSHPVKLEELLNWNRELAETAEEEVPEVVQACNATLRHNFSFEIGRCRQRLVGWVELMLASTEDFLPLARFVFSLECAPCESVYSSDMSSKWLEKSTSKEDRSWFLLLSQCGYRRLSVKAYEALLDRKEVNKQGADRLQGVLLQNHFLSYLVGNFLYDTGPYIVLPLLGGVVMWSLGTSLWLSGCLVALSLLPSVFLLLTDPIVMQSVFGRIPVNSSEVGHGTSADLVHKQVRSSPQQENGSALVHSQVT